MENKSDMLAPCGIYCGACPSYGKSCKGCSSEDKKQTRSSKWNCPIRTCCYSEKHLSYCLYCTDFPCKLVNKKLLKTHPTNAKYTYRHEVATLFPLLKTEGLSAYLEMQKQRWTCTMCGETVWFYHYRCSTCGKEVKP